ncbi:hypothetical protein SAFG77S_13481 [Streptomyces afghaniensis]
MEINIAELIRDYRMMKEKLKGYKELFMEKSVPMRSWGVAQYGIEATLPHGSFGKRQAELRDMDIRERNK